MSCEAAGKQSTGRCVVEVHEDTTPDPPPPGTRLRMPYRGTFIGIPTNYGFMAPQKYGPDRSAAVARKAEYTGQLKAVLGGLRVNRPTVSSDKCEGGYSGNYCSSGGEYSVGNPDVRMSIFRRDTSTAPSVLRFTQLLGRATCTNCVDKGLAGQIGRWEFNPPINLNYNDAIILLLDGPGTGYCATNHHEFDNWLASSWTDPLRCGPCRDQWYSIWDGGVDENSTNWKRAETENVIPNDDAFTLEFVDGANVIYAGSVTAPPGDTNFQNAGGGTFNNVRRIRMLFTYTDAVFDVTKVGLSGHRNSDHASPVICELKSATGTLIKSAQIPATEYTVGRPDLNANDSVYKFGTAPMTAVIQPNTEYWLEFRTAGADSYTTYMDPWTETLGANINRHRDYINMTAWLSTNSGGNWTRGVSTTFGGRQMVGIRGGLIGLARTA